MENEKMKKLREELHGLQDKKDEISREINELYDALEYESRKQNEAYVDQCYKKEIEGETHYFRVCSVVSNNRSRASVFHLKTPVILRAVSGAGISKYRHNLWLEGEIECMDCTPDGEDGWLKDATEITNEEFADAVTDIMQKLTHGICTMVVPLEDVEQGTETFIMA